MADHLLLTVESADPEDLEWFTGRLREELLLTDVDDVQWATAEDLPAGAKSALAFDWNTLVITLAESGSVLLGLMGALTAWVQRNQGVTVHLTAPDGTTIHIRGQELDGDTIERLALLLRSPATSGLAPLPNATPLPAALHQRLRAALAECELFTHDTALRDFFIQAPLQPWRNRLPQAATIQQRVDSTISYLSAEQTSDGLNALLIFVQQLSQHYPPGDGRRAVLAGLASELAEGYP